MIEYFISFVLAFIVAFIVTPIAKKIAFKVGAIDVPKDERRMHRKPIALMGGLAIVTGFLISVFFEIIGSYFSASSILEVDRELFGLIGAIFIIVTIGVLDDIKPLNAKFRLVFQVLAAILVVSSGTTIVNVTNPFARFGMSTLPAYISYPVTVIWIVGVTNAINLIDGLDGLAAGVSSIASLSLFFISALMPGMGTAAMLTAILAGATLGFLPFNFNPAKIFMGSTGAYFLGFTLGVISIQGTLKSYTAIAIAVPLLVLGLPLFDTLFAIFRRLMNGKSIMEGDKSHLHHRLIDMGLSHKQSVVVMYITSACLGLCAIVLAGKGAISAIVLVISLSVFVVGGAKYMSAFEDSKEAGEDMMDEEKEISDNNAKVIMNEPKDAGN